jgi:hypothetical protein
MCIRGPVCPIIFQGVMAFGLFRVVNIGGKTILREEIPTYATVLKVY